MTDDEVDAAFEAKQVFLRKVREALREMKSSLSEDQFDYIIDCCQDALSLFSPWMNAED